MTDYNMVNYAKTVAVPAQRVDGGDYGGRGRDYFDQINTTTAMTTADKIFCGYLMPNERFLGAIIVSGAQGSGRTLKLGDAGDDDRYLDAASVASAAVLECRKIDGFGYKNSTPDPIPLFLTIAGGTLAALSPGLKIHIRVGAV